MRKLTIAIILTGLCVVGLTARYQTPTPTAGDLPFAVGDEILVYWATETRITSATDTCKIGEIRGTFIRCTDFKGPNWINLQQAKLLSKVERKK